VSGIVHVFDGCISLLQMFKEKKFFRKLKGYVEIYYKKNLDVQSDQKENKSEQALQIIGHVVQCMGVDNLWSQTLLYKL
jgi:hypothetical protein